MRVRVQGGADSLELRRERLLLCTERDQQVAGASDKESFLFAGGITSLCWPGNALASPGGAAGSFLVKRGQGYTAGPAATLTDTRLGSRWMDDCNH